MVSILPQNLPKSRKQPQSREGGFSLINPSKYEYLKAPQKASKPGFSP
jgi:hypothetical protein